MTLEIIEMSLTFNQLSYQCSTTSKTFFWLNNILMLHWKSLKSTWIKFNFMEMWRIEPMTLVIIDMSLTLIQLSCQCSQNSETFFWLYNLLMLHWKSLKSTWFKFNYLKVWKIEPMTLEIIEMSLTLIQLSYQCSPNSTMFFLAIQYTHVTLKVIKINLN